jgi:tetratricopeptide (TPR) repeat protein
MNVRAALLACLTVFATAGLFAQHTPSLADLEARARTDSNDPAAHFALAQAWLQAKQQDSARRALETAVLIDREFAPAYLLLGRIEGALLPAPLMAIQTTGGIHILRLRRPALQDSAALLLRRGFLLDPLQEGYPLASLYIPVAWRGTLEHALREYRLNRLEATVAILDTVITQSDRQHKPPPPVALWYHALSEIGVHQPDSAIRDVQRLLDQAMRDSTVFAEEASRSVRYALAFLNQHAGHSQEAERLYKQTVEEDLSLDLAHVQLASIYEAQQRWPEAIQERRNALLVASGDPTLLYDLGVTLLEAGQTSEAADTLRRVVALNPRESRASYMLGIAAARLGAYQEARDAYTRFLQLAPSRYTDMIADARERLAHLPPP